MNAVLRKVVGVVAARARAFAQAMRPLLRSLQPAAQRARKWLTARFKQLRAWIPQNRRAATLGGIGATVMVVMVLAAIPGTPSERQTWRLSLSGRELFAQLTEEHPGVARGSQVDETEGRGSRTNLIVVPDPVWQQLSVDQRNSLGSWLNQLGGRWEIRVGRASDDGERVLDAAAAMTSRQWNQQLK